MPVHHFHSIREFSCRCVALFKRTVRSLSCCGAKSGDPRFLLLKRFPHVAKKSYRCSFTASPTAHQSSWKTRRHGLAARAVETLGREKGSGIPSLGPATVATLDDAAPSSLRNHLIALLVSAGRLMFFFINL